MEWSEALSGGLLQAAPDAILVMDEGRIVLVNDRAEELFGWPRAELLGESANRLITQSSLADLPGQLERRSAEPAPGPMGTIAVTACRRDGSQFPV